MLWECSLAKLRALAWTVYADQMLQEAAAAGPDDAFHKDVEAVKQSGQRVPLVTYEDGKNCIHISEQRNLALFIAAGFQTIIVSRVSSPHASGSGVVLNPDLNSESRIQPITIVIAHPDDEILFLWPFLPYVDRIVCVVTDEDNERRRWCHERKVPLIEICSQLGCQVHFIGMDSGFYRAERAGLRAIATEIRGAIDGAKVVATHNEWGEYGHGDHIFCHQAVRAAAPITLVTDQMIPRDWLPLYRWNVARSLELGSFTLDRKQFDHFKSHYDGRKVWTYDTPVIERCKVSVC